MVHPSTEKFEKTVLVHIELGLALSAVMSVAQTAVAHRNRLCRVMWRFPGKGRA
jgi:hypothetical protein